jgi:hypothetical protein
MERDFAPKILQKNVILRLHFDRSKGSLIISLL